MSKGPIVQVRRSRTIEGAGTALAPKPKLNTVYLFKATLAVKLAREMITARQFKPILESEGRGDDVGRARKQKNFKSQFIYFWSNSPQRFSSRFCR
jgi:hypothetical protein